jgi:hypothetical protein
MIEVILKGGLGNQMFQYAAAYALATKLKTQIQLNDVFLNTDLPIPGFTKRKYELDLFGILNNSIHKSNSYTSYLTKSLSLVTKPNTFIQGNPALSPFYRLTGIKAKEDPYMYYKDFEILKDGAILDGFFHNYRYFDAYEEQLKAIFNTQLVQDDSYASLEKDLGNETSVAIHIRLGDYLNAKNKKIYLDLHDYYQEAITKARETIHNPHFYVFAVDMSDSTEVGKYLKLEAGEFTHLGSQYTGERFGTYFRLFSLCNAAIVSNSSFSFWAAYVGQSKFTVCPHRWTYLHSKFDVPKNWIGVYN